MVRLPDLQAELDRLMHPELYRDYGPNGLQVPGNMDIETLVTSVSASVAAFERAVSEGAQAVLVHHGLFWAGMPQEIDRTLHRRLKPLFVHDIALLAYHLPLDAHLGLGNNALLARGLGCVDVAPHFEHGGAPIGVTARFDGDGVSADELHARVAALTEREPLHLRFGPDPVRTIGIVSGGAAGDLGGAIEAGLDAFLTGEPAERVYTQAREARIHFLAAGHYATETFGIRALGDWCAERFGIRHVFAHDPNPI
jgi:dinuclear metal center YbgI/SA1388 family protein